MSVTDEQFRSSIKDLEWRLNQLELLVRGEQTQHNQRSTLSEKVSTASNELQTILQNDPNLAEFVRKYEHLRSLSQDTGNLMNPESQLALILASEDLIREQQRALHFIHEHEKFINSENYQISPNVRKSLVPIERNILDQVDETVAQHNNVEKLLNSYNQVIGIVSEKFLYWDQLLSSWEKKLGLEQTK